MSVSVYSCINCGGALRFDIQTSAFQCDYCRSGYTLEQLNAAYPDEDGATWSKVWEDANEEKAFDVSFTENTETKEAVVKVYECPACGAEVMADSDTLAAAFCAFCGNPVSVAERLLSGEGLPCRVIPFRKTKEEAFAILQDRAKNKPLLPKAFRKQMKPDTLKSVYVPFRLYDAGCSGNIIARCENISTWSDSDYRYTKTDTYEARRSGSMVFARVPMDVSDKIDDDTMQAIEPFDLNGLTPFTMKYLAGHFAEAPTTKEDTLRDTLFRRLRPAAESAMRSTVHGYDRVSVTSSAFSVESAVSEYVMFPVWMVVSSFKGKEYIHTVNGQTGKFVGHFPVDWPYAGRLFLKLAGALFAAVFLALEVSLWLS